MILYYILFYSITKVYEYLEDRIFVNFTRFFLIVRTGLDAELADKVN